VKSYSAGISESGISSAVLYFFDQLWAFSKAALNSFDPSANTFFF
jgi:hypothetical protein